ncbi:uncharacterized protein ACNLHF_015225 [Anomaloglossus baeobatrachus]|uniref:uncharacterized protein LOC142301908 n=1 Tax=Anomaloglossus baeobatrachus TaxID=238106 RepID=UPI003F507FA0
MAPGVYVLLLSVLLAAVSPGWAAPVDSWDEDKVGQLDYQDMAEVKIGEDYLLMEPQNSSQTEAETTQASWTSVNSTQEVKNQSEYENPADKKWRDSEDDWWETEDDWQEQESVADRSKEAASEGEKSPWELWPVTHRYWWEPEPKIEKPQWEVKKQDVEPWWQKVAVEDGAYEWGRPNMVDAQYRGSDDVKAEAKDAKEERPQWWAWSVTKSPWWEADNKAEKPLWETQEKAKDPWWEMDTDGKFPQEKEWFPTKKQDENEIRPDDDSDEYEVLDVNIDDLDTDDFEEIPVKQEIFPHENKENIVFHEKSGSVYFWAFLVTLSILVAVLFMIYHKRRLTQQKRFIFALDGGLFGDSKRPNSGEYERLDNKI